MDAQLSTVTVPVSDVRRAKAFYAGVLGFEILDDENVWTGRKTVHVVRLAPRGTGAAIMLANWFPSMVPGSLRGLVFETEDIEACRRTLLAAGASPSDIIAAPWGRLTVVSDPDGNHLTFQQLAAAPGG
ncbi:VOC family protein [Paracraurococcus lichenis]|uniref:VOC family protein n=1 Tax=Paracraurococcus lichenis TaxID=3064888 RepID=A0ABT9DTE4_9PROT|nr:VOC family protein [Paracraurococcus sp. LOR1-02]MDO9707179.1 VOC family protein [Paracraurococcus sp. LOR1-02]